MATKKEHALELFNWWMPAGHFSHKWDEERKLSFMFETPSVQYDPQIRKIEAAVKIWGKEKCGMTAAENSGMVWSNQKHQFVSGFEQS